MKVTRLQTKKKKLEAEVYVTILMESNAHNIGNDMTELRFSRPLRIAGGEVVSILTSPNMTCARLLSSGDFSNVDLSLFTLDDLLSLLLRIEQREFQVISNAKVG